MALTYMCTCSRHDSKWKCIMHVAGWICIGNACAISQGACFKTSIYFSLYCSAHLRFRGDDPKPACSARQDLVDWLRQSIGTLIIVQKKCYRACYVSILKIVAFQPNVCFFNYMRSAKHRHRIASCLHAQQNIHI